MENASFALSITSVKIIYQRLIIYVIVICSKYLEELKSSTLTLDLMFNSHHQ